MKIVSLILLKLRHVRISWRNTRNLLRASHRFGRATSGMNCKSSVLRHFKLAISKRDSVKSLCHTLVSLRRFSFLRYLWNLIAVKQPFTECLWANWTSRSSIWLYLVRELLRISIFIVQFAATSVTFSFLRFWSLPITENTIVYMTRFTFSSLS